MLLCVTQSLILAPFIILNDLTNVERDVKHQTIIIINRIDLSKLCNHDQYLIDHRSFASTENRLNNDHRSVSSTDNRLNIDHERPIMPHSQSKAFPRHQKKKKKKKRRDEEYAMLSVLCGVLCLFAVDMVFPVVVFLNNRSHLSFFVAMRGLL